MKSSDKEKWAEVSEEEYNNEQIWHFQACSCTSSQKKSTNFVIAMCNEKDDEWDLQGQESQQKAMNKLMDNTLTNAQLLNLLWMTLPYELSWW